MLGVRQNRVGRVCADKSAILAMSMEERRALADDLRKELIESTHQERLQGYGFRLVEKADSITQIMMEKDEDLPWDELQVILQGMEDDRLTRIKAKGGIQLSIQQQKVDPADRATGSTVEKTQR